MFIHDNIQAAIFDLDGTLIDSMWVWNKIDMDYLKENDKDYIFGETIEKITWGMIAQNHSDRTKWIPIIFGN